MAGTEEDWDGAPMIIEPGAFAGQDGKTIPVSWGGLGGPVIGQAVLSAAGDGAIASMSFAVLRHLDGTACPGSGCEKCAVDDLLTGNLYYTLDRDTRPDGG